MQLRYVIRDKIRYKIQSEKKSEKKFFLSEKKIVRKNICHGHCLGFPVCKVSSLGQIDAYHH